MYALKDIVDSTLHLLSRPPRPPDVGGATLSLGELVAATDTDTTESAAPLPPSADFTSVPAPISPSPSSFSLFNTNTNIEHALDLANHLRDFDDSVESYSTQPDCINKPLPQTPLPISASSSSFSFLDADPETDLDFYDDELDSAAPTARDLARLRAELKATRDHNAALQTALRESHGQIRSRDTLIETLRSRARKLETDVAEAKRTADERRLELRSVEGFLTKTDRWAGTDLIQAVKDINNEILQFAATSAEGFPAPGVAGSSGSSGAGTSSTQRRPTPTSAAARAASASPTPATTSVSSPGRRKALERVAARFGSKLRQCLESRDHAADPTILQYALQACVCQCIAHAVASFCFGSTGKLESHLSKIYQHMHASEPQPTSSRWRALTHAHIRALSPNLDAIAVAEVTDTALRGVANVLSAGGFGEVDALLARAGSRHRAQLRRIAELANRLAFVLREGTMSTDFQPMFVESVREFSALSMENVYDGYGPSRGRVLCTTEIGLQALTNKGKDGKDFSASTIERKVVLKPRVVLESVVQMLDR